MKSKNRVGKIVRFMVFFLMSVSCGCITTNHQKTLSEVLVDCYGSLENAISQPWTVCPVIPIPGKKYRVVKLTNNQKMKVLSVIKDCIQPDRTEQGPRGGCVPFGMYDLTIGPGPYDRSAPDFQIYFVEQGFLRDFVPPTPEGVFEVYYTLMWVLAGMPEDPDIEEVVPKDEEKDTKSP